MWYLLNKDTKIQVKTAHVMTKEEHVGDCLGQGTAMDFSKSRLTGVSNPLPLLGS